MRCLVVAGGTAQGSRGTIDEARAALAPVARDPLVAGGPADAELLGDVRDGPAGLDAGDQQLAAEDGQPGSRMCHESPPSIWSF